MSEDDEPTCPYCGAMWYEAKSEGAPCGIDECMEFTCCKKAWEEHCKKEHPEYYAKEMAK